GNEYTYMVSACNQVDCSPPASLMVDYSAPNTPMNLVASHSGNNVTITWTEVPDATFYNISRDNVELNADVTALTYTDTTVMQGMTYTYMVSACNHLGCSDANSTSIQLPLDTDGDGTPGTPMNLVASHSGNNVTITWTEVPDATFYNISRDNVELNVNVTALTYTDTTVMQGMTYTYMVSACNQVDCSPPISAIFRLVLITADDTDGDGVDNSIDVDDDGDGLIEIYTAQELNAVRNNLDGTGLIRTPGAESDSNGCGGATNSNGAIITTACSGYELMADINLNDLDLITSGDFQDSNWQPLGGCTASDCPPVSVNQSLAVIQPFAADFNGNGYIIANLTINTTETQYGVGLFGAIAPSASISNVSIRNASITAPSSVYVGVLVGWAKGATISSSSVVANQITGADRTGGLVGSGRSMTISSSSVRANQITGSGRIGGLVGSAEDAMISFSSAAVNQITGSSSNIGGLVGFGQGATISSSSVVANQITGSFYVGGLVGWGESTRKGATISSSSVVVNQINGSGEHVGGLVGNGRNMQIRSSSAAVYQIIGSNNVGGLAGDGFASVINSSLAITKKITGVTNVDGLAGLSASSSEGDLSYWDNGVITFMGVRSGFIDVGRSTSELRTPTMFAGIYSTWDNGYCNPTTGAYITVADGASAAEGFQRAWNLGTNMQYPALTCLPNFTADEQRMVRAAALDGNSPVDKYKELTSNR
ncbi:MAG: hypothetical protein HAW61_01275, partial [Candidatus Portiera sp.]|nr:hypothetical protein [Portiera sp.]